MKITLILAAIAQLASAHYFFDTTIVNGVSSTKYIRVSTRPTKYNPIKFSSNAAADIRDNSYIDKGDDARCNQGAFTNAKSTSVLSVAAGTKIKFQLAVSAKMQHPGPAFVYMSKAPTGDVTAYDGSGDWFKIYQEGACSKTADFTTVAWCSYNSNFVEATIPKDVPSGEYLVRVEHIGIHKSFLNQPEHFVSCAQVKVTGGGSGTPGPTVKFPGAYKNTDSYATMSIYNGYKELVYPGPAVWTGGSTSGASVNETEPEVVSPVTATPVPTTLVSVIKSATKAATTKSSTTKAASQVTKAAADNSSCDA